MESDAVSPYGVVARFVDNDSSIFIRYYIICRYGVVAAIPKFDAVQRVVHHYVADYDVVIGFSEIKSFNIVAGVIAFHGIIAGFGELDAVLRVVDPNVADYGVVVRILKTYVVVQVVISNVLCDDGIVRIL